jgi:hypothetical protein
MDMIFDLKSCQGNTEVRNRFCVPYFKCIGFEYKKGPQALMTYEPNCVLMIKGYLLESSFSSSEIRSFKRFSLPFAASWYLASKIIISSL